MRRGLVALLLALATTTGAGDVLDGLDGTWGLPPIDGKPGVTGSYFTLAHGAGDALHVSLSLNPDGWNCGSDVDVVWKAGDARFEWPNRGDGGASAPCWLEASRKDDQLDVRVFCPYECTSGESVHKITLERIAADGLVPPEHVVHTFCASHDTLRQEFCRPGEIQKLIAEGNLAGRQRSALSDGNDAAASLPETTADLLAILATCRTAAGGPACLVQALRARRDTHAAAVAERQKVLADERRRSEAAAVPVTDAAAWTGARYLVNDNFVAALTIDRCDAKQCDLSVSGDTNYTFGYQEHHGECMLEHNSLTLTASDRGFAYVEPGESDRNAEGAGPFANFCRFDLTRSGDAIHVAIRGMGCMEWCSNAQFPGLAGDYHPHPKPSFTCPAEVWVEAWDEQNLCLDPELAALDREMAAAFAKAKAGTAGAAQAALVKGQRAWIAKRREECNVDKRRTCLAEAYRKRLAELAAK